MKGSMRFVIEAVIFAGVLYLLSAAARMLQGMYMTEAYVPDILNQYESVDYLSHKTTFGVIGKADWRMTAMEWILPGILYFGARVLISRVLRRRRQR